MDEILNAQRTKQPSTFESLMGAATDPQFYRDMGSRVFDALVGGVRDVLPTGASPQLAAQLRAKGMQNVPEDSAFQQKLREIALAGLTVYHGSPHLFDKFDMSKIGTGEGAQAYGHGLYVAENPEVAKSYAQMAQSHSYLPHSNANPFNNGWMFNKQVIDNKYTDKWVVDNMKGEQLSVHNSAAEAEAAALKANGLSENLYKADIPDEAVARMLDWDKPLSQQPEIALAIRKSLQGNKGFEGFSPETTGMSLYEQLQNRALSYDGNPLNEAFKKSGGNQQAVVSDYLRSIGIPGIRYADAMSRGTGAGTSNYVLFSDQLPRILERNAQPTGVVPWQPGEFK
jgi:hypothetical protein